MLVFTVGQSRVVFTQLPCESVLIRMAASKAVTYHNSPQKALWASTQKISVCWSHMEPLLSSRSVLATEKTPPNARPRTIALSVEERSNNSTGVKYSLYNFQIRVFKDLDFTIIHLFVPEDTRSHLHVLSAPLPSRTLSPSPFSNWMPAS